MNHIATSLSSTALAVLFSISTIHAADQIAGYAFIDGNPRDGQYTMGNEPSVAGVSLYSDENGNGRQDFDSLKWFYPASSQQNKIIPQSSGGIPVDSEIIVTNPNSGRNWLGRFFVSITRLDYTVPYDLVVSIVGPNGTEANLFQNPAASSGMLPVGAPFCKDIYFASFVPDSGDFVNFSSEAPPYTPNRIYKTSGTLQVLHGRSAKEMGTWKLRIRTSGRGSGKLYSWRLGVNMSEPNAFTGSNGWYTLNCNSGSHTLRMSPNAQYLFNPMDAVYHFPQSFFVTSVAGHAFIDLPMVGK